MLRKLRHDIIAMEDYVAADRRPVGQCRQDIHQADIYDKGNSVGCALRSIHV